MSNTEVAIWYFTSNRTLSVKDVCLYVDVVNVTVSVCEVRLIYKYKGNRQHKKCFGYIIYRSICVNWRKSLGYNKQKKKSKNKVE